jgi:two-component system, chemotaxis family, chemotaxis protein CheY
MKTPDAFPNLNTKRPDGLRPNSRPYRVMVVEDKEFQRKQIAQILESEGYDIVATASNGQEALKKFERLDAPLDLLTTNLDMPILDGYALLYELNQKPNRPVIVFVSDETTKGVMQDLISMGIGDYILKPINRRVLLERIKAVVTKRVK